MCLSGFTKKPGGKCSAWGFFHAALCFLLHLAPFSSLLELSCLAFYIFIAPVKNFQHGQVLVFSHHHVR